MGYNWRTTLSEFSRTSSVLAGFCITFMALIISRLADIEPTSFSQVSLLFFGISVVLFITATQLFLQAKDFDVFSIPESYKKLLQEDCKMKNKDWGAFEDEQTLQCRKKEKMGRYSYNLAFILTFFGLGFSLVLINVVFAVIVTSLGVGFECWQGYAFFKNSKKVDKNKLQTPNQLRKVD
jgi:hypothetical protein